jgi:hypothetical protein
LSEANRKAARQRADVKRFMQQVLKESGPRDTKYLHGKVYYQRKIPVSIGYVRQCLREMSTIDQMLDKERVGRTIEYKAREAE